MDISEAADWLAVAPSTTGLFTDFDGTLSPIVRRPEDASPLPGVPGVLKRIAARMRVVAVVSGRPVAWLVDQLELAAADGPADGVVQAYGLHGLEHWTARGIELDEAAMGWQPAIAQARESADAAGLPGVVVEDKRFGVTLHWRNAPDPDRAGELASQLAERLAGASGLITRAGKSSVELVPPVGVDKGTVVRRWVEQGGANRVAFLGDDVSDVLAFVAIDRLVGGNTPETGPVAGLKVAVTGDDVPAELIERADLVLSGPEEAVLLLAELTKRLEAAG
jgi:trehalose 6-phosphate phosphatase